MQKFIYKLQLRMGGKCISNLMKYIVVGMATVFVLDQVFATFSFSSMLGLYMPAVLSGQVWRLITFIFIPPNTSLLFIVFALYFYYVIGTALENQWGSFAFYVYYFLGVIGCLISAVLTGYGTNTFLNLSLFLAFAAMFPDFQVLLFFVLPVKIKWIAYLDAAVYLYYFIMGPWTTRIQILFSLVNFFLFFGKGLFLRTKQEIGYLKHRRQWKN